MLTIYTIDSPLTVKHFELGVCADRVTHAILGETLVDRIIPGRPSRLNSQHRTGLTIADYLVNDLIPAQRRRNLFVVFSPVDVWPRVTARATVEGCHAVALRLLRSRLHCQRRRFCEHE